MSKYADLNESLFEAFLTTGQSPTSDQLDELFSVGMSESAEFVNNLVDEVTAHLGHGDDERELADSLLPRLADAALPVDLVALVAIFELAKSKITEPVA